MKTATAAGAPPRTVETIALRAAENQPFALRMDRRVRYWVDGMVIGSDIFVKNLMARTRGEAAMARRRLTRALAPDRLTARSAPIPAMPCVSRPGTGPGLPLASLTALMASH